MRIQHAQALPSLPRAVTELQRISRASELVSNRPLVAIGLPYAGALNDRAAPESWTDFASRQTRLLNWLTPWRGAGSIRTINGYSGQQTKLMRELPRALQSFPDERSIQTLCRFPELRFIVAFAGTALPSNLPSALRLVYAENDQPTLLELRCDAVPFKLRELVMPAAAASITCATDTPDLLSVTGSTPQKWDLQRSAGEISIRKAASDATKSRHLTWVTITAEQSATLRDCRLTFE